MPGSNSNVRSPNVTPTEATVMPPQISHHTTRQRRPGGRPSGNRRNAPKMAPNATPNAICIVHPATDTNGSQWRSPSARAPYSEEVTASSMPIAPTWYRGPSGLAGAFAVRIAPTTAIPAVPSSTTTRRLAASSDGP